MIWNDTSTADECEIAKNTSNRQCFWSSMNLNKFDGGTYNSNIYIATQQMRDFVRCGGGDRWSSEFHCQTLLTLLKEVVHC